MKINDSNRINGVTNQYNVQNNKRLKELESKQRKDEVRISPEAMEMLSSSQGGCVERAKQIAELKQSVSSGAYHVEAGKIAEKLLPYLKGNHLNE